MRRKDRPWVDILTDKHECGSSLSDYVPLELPLEGRMMTLWIPEAIRPIDLLEIKAVIGSGPLISLIAYHPGDEEIEEITVLMVAGRSDDGSYVVHVWHELYPWALKYLGLSEEGANH